MAVWIHLDCNHGLFSLAINLSITLLINKLVVQALKWSISVIPKAQDDIFKCFVLSTTQTYSVYGHRGLTENN